MVNCDEGNITIYTEEKYYNIRVNVGLETFTIKDYKSDIDKDKIKTDFKNYYDTLNLPAIVYCIITGLITTRI